MISCTEFIPAYSEGFKFIEQTHGRNELEKFWSFLSDLYLNDSLRKLVAEEGLEGCYTYWSHSLNEEAADFTMILDEIKGEFIIDMHKCPSKGMLNEFKHLEPYHSYCDHCPALYKPVVERYGYKYYEDSSNCKKASCCTTISIKTDK
ncbi:MAG: hypothetical protein LLG13_03325 [Bacteroidales bacterium]|nr:hypothetical protein [Bacteroidales bacterium]